MKARYIPLLAALVLFASNTSAESQRVHFSQAELEQMLAPIALYPDVLLSKVLMAATYPIEVVEAARWSRSQPQLEGNQAVEAVAQENWDLSVRELTAFPELIQLMDENLTWTRRLGDAFLLQEEELIETVQKLRAKALNNGGMDDLANVRIERRDTVIVIEPARPQVIHVPYYNTRVVYGNWGWYDYPPVFWAPPSHFSFTFNRSIYWSRPYRLYAGFGWSYFDWPCRSVVVVNPPPRRPHYTNYRPKTHPVRLTPSGSVRWQHDPSIRRGTRNTSFGERSDLNAGRIQRQASAEQAPPPRAPRPQAIASRPSPQPQQQIRTPIATSNSDRIIRRDAPANVRPQTAPREARPQQVSPPVQQAPRNPPNVQPRPRPTAPPAPPAPPPPSARAERAPAENRYLRPDGMEQMR